MRIVINGQIDPRRSGGIAQVLAGLAHALGQLDGPEEYVFVCSPQSAPWLAPHLGANSKIETNRKCTAAPKRGIRESDGFWESFAPDVLHFPYQSYTRTDIPSVFNPHDLQHVHLPHLFEEEERARRESLYGEACRHAAAVAVTSRFVKDDVVRQYEIPADKVHVIWWGAPTSVYEHPTPADVSNVLARHRIAEPYAIYPAQTWPHKNHKLLLEALQRICGPCAMPLSLVCTGAKTDYYQELHSLVIRFGLEDHVRFLGWIEERELMALYRAARMMIVPTRFEAVSFPVFEAFDMGIPVACSAVTSLPEQVGDAAILFEPHDTEGLISAIRRLHEDESLRRTLISRGYDRVKQFTWRSTAEGYRALYRRVACGAASVASVPGVPAKT